MRAVIVHGDEWILKITRIIEADGSLVGGSDGVTPSNTKVVGVAR